MARPDQLRGQVEEENLRQPGRGHFDLVNLRTLSVSEPVGEHFAALAALREAGLVLVGATGFEPVTPRL